MKHARDMTHEQLVRIVDDIQQILYLSANAQGMIWDPDKEWDCETIEYVAGVLEDAGLNPEREMPREQPGADTPVLINDEIATTPKVDEARMHTFFKHKVSEWMNDGEEEVVRVLTLWATREATSIQPRIELGPYLDEYFAGVDDSEDGAEAR